MRLSPLPPVLGGRGRGMEGKLERETTCPWLRSSLSPNPSPRRARGFEGLGDFGYRQRFDGLVNFCQNYG